MISKIFFIRYMKRLVKVVFNVIVIIIDFLWVFIFLLNVWMLELKNKMLIYVYINY